MNRHAYLEDVNLEELFVKAELNREESERLAVEPYSYWASVFKEFRKKPAAVISLVLMIVMVLMAIFVPIFSPYNPAAPSVERRLLPSADHLFGTDTMGYDIFTRIWFGARTSLMIAFVVSLINVTIGLIMGTIWGYFRQIDLIMLEVANFVTNIPGFLYYMIVGYVLRLAGVPSILSLVIAMTMIGWVPMSRWIRNQILIFNNREYNIASRTLGTPPRRVIIYNLLPYILTVVITDASMQIPAVIGTEVGLAYFGIGLSITDISLGRILRDAYNSWMANPHTLFFPAFVVGLLTIVFYLIGLSLADALDPKTHR